MAPFTKQMLAETLKRLMESKSLEKITVKELVEACGVNRQTFYYHFQDVYDLLGWIYRTEAVDAMSGLSSGNWQEGLLFVLEYVDGNRKLCAETYRSLAREHLERFLNETFQPLLKQIIDGAAREKGLSKADESFIVRFYGYALSGMLLEWIDSGFEMPVDVLRKRLAHIMEGALVQAVDRLRTGCGDRSATHDQQ